jgi:hypothetical protein
MEESFSLQKLVHDIKTSEIQVQSWKDFEALIYKLARVQDTRCYRNVESSPDVQLSNGFGLEAKLIGSPTRDINLNSAAPDPKTFYVVAYCPSKTIRDIAIVSGANFFSPEIEEIETTNTSLRDLSNKLLRYRTRIMWQLKSPFVIWGRGHYVVDEFGVKKLLA